MGARSKVVEGQAYIRNVDLIDITLLIIIVILVLAEVGSDSVKSLLDCITVLADGRASLAH
jgi:hypothetical protein